VSSSSALELDAPAKLNLFLEVLARRPDGYHEIDSVFVAIDLRDRLRLERAPSISLEVEGEEVPRGPANLAWKAAEALGVGARIRLEKRIPVGSGLGGGSSDAAAVLLGLDRLYGMGLGPDGLLDAARRLGADVPFFLRKGLARCTGIGDRVQPLPPGPPRRFLLACPSLPLETRRVYEALGPGLTGNRETATVFLQKYLAPAAGPVPFFNRLQEVAERLEPRLREVRQEAERRYGAAFTMTGSGSAYFAGVPPGAPEDGKFETAEGIRVRVTTVAT
jgi:4-diphosphocytidyl-2-C-methyl-D-erythritol kinase